MSNNFKVAEGGVRYYPKDQEVPTDVPGFTRDVNNPFMFHPDFDPCKYRCEVKRRCQLGKIKIVQHCNLLGKDVNAETCAFCDLLESEPNVS